MSNPLLHRVHHYLFGLSWYLHEVMVEYRVVSCIGQIIIDTDIEHFLLVIINPDYFPAPVAILVAQIQSKKYGEQEVDLLYPSPWIAI
jgi:hypothetical protein